MGTLHPTLLLTSGDVDCSYGQNGNIWFLTGATVAGNTTRSCKVPTGTHPRIQYREEQPVPATNMLQHFGGDAPGPDWPSTLVFPAASDGYWLMLNPLSPGPHIINFGGTAKNTSFQLDITYNITVVPKGRF